METRKGTWKEERISAEKNRTTANELLCNTFTFLASADKCAAIMRNGWGGVGGEVQTLKFFFSRGPSEALNHEHRMRVTGFLSEKDGPRERKAAFHW